MTVSFYVAVHLVNAHIVKTSGLHYGSHEKVNNALNPEQRLSPSKLPEEVYLSYSKLQNLSRRARYLSNGSKGKVSEQTFLTYDKHFSKAIRHLDKLMNYIKSKYDINFDSKNLKCLELKNLKSDFFTVS